MRKVLYLEVRSGLCNRLRALVSGICLTEDLNYDLMVFWPSTNPESAAAFQDLYELGSLPKWVRIVDQRMPYLNVRCDTKADAMKAVHHNMPINSNAHFYKTDSKRFSGHLRNLLPVRDVLTELNNNFQALPEGCQSIGVHIRRTDNKKSILESPLEGFIHAMKAIKKGFFFLSTDDEEVALDLNRSFPGRIYSHEKLRNRDTVEGMKEAMVSLYTLASCSVILGCHGSSFSGYAAEIGGKKVRRIGY